MHLLAISLLTILAGTLLLAKFRKDMPGKFFAFISWFFIVVGFLLFIGFIGRGICRISHHGFPGPHKCHHEMMMKGCNYGMHGGFCCPQGIDKGMCLQKPCCMTHDDVMKCCPEDMDKAMCCPKPGCMSHDSMMKYCRKHQESDSVKMPVRKK